jgi:hypothetical protein
MQRVVTANPLNRSHPRNQGLVAYWPFLPHLNGGPTLFDATGQFHATLPPPVNHYAWSSSGVGGSLSIGLSGTPSTTMQTPVILTTTTALTVAGWFYRSSLVINYPGLLYQIGGGGTGTNACGLIGNQPGTSLVYNWNNSASAYMFASGLTIPSNQWFFAAMSVSPTQALLCLGTSGGWGQAINAIAHASTTLTTGWNWGYASNSYWIGSFGPAKIWRRALTANELQAEMEDQLAGNPALNYL